MKDRNDVAPRLLELEIAQIDAFTDRVFGGNPAAVVHLSEWPSDATLQAIAAENNLSETAFLVGRIPADAPAPPSNSPSHHLRWFTPTVEIELCGHATLASAAHLFASADAGCQDFGACDGDDSLDDDANASPDRLDFWTMSGWLSVTRTRGHDGGGDLFTLDFPADVPAPIDADSPALSAAAKNDVEMPGDASKGGTMTADPVVMAGRLRTSIAEALGIDAASIIDMGSGRTMLLVVVDSPDLIRPLSPDFAAIVRIAPHGIIVTADATGDTNGPDAGHDVVTRYFAPGIGIDEDPVTGSAHCVLGPYWFGRLRRDRLTAHQASARGGTLHLAADDERIRISGHAVRYMSGTIRVPVQ
ncbi:PhzF family phenazine biosynthesis protein [Corynebacterium sp. NPDC060344]|uniref:PhzF family phenazine biosynthesis protein n=1 Tax=Corynebacterium sp. NPDC060344 TaxID=3347101 RepID=UPI003664E3AC